MHPDDPDYIPREREISLCPCKSRRAYEDCCMPYHYGRAKPATAEALMRSRYSAFFFRRVDYLVDTTHPDSRGPNLKDELAASVHQYNWFCLEILHSSKGGKEDKTGKVEFVADYFADGVAGELHENSRFKRYKGSWKYLDAKG